MDGSEVAVHRLWLMLRCGVAVAGRRAPRYEFVRGVVRSEPLTEGWDGRLGEIRPRGDGGGDEMMR